MLLCVVFVKRRIFMTKFEVIYEFDGKKVWENVFAKDEGHAKNKILERNNYNNIVFLNIEKV